MANMVDVPSRRLVLVGPHARSAWIRIQPSSDPRCMFVVFTVGKPPELERSTSLDTVVIQGDGFFEQLV